MLAILIMVIVSWYLYMSTYHTVCFKYMYLIVYQYISIKTEEKNVSFDTFEKN